MNLEQNVAFVEVWTGSYDIRRATLIERFTGHVTPRSIYSMYHFMILRIVTHNITQDMSGFTFGYIHGK